ncbi:T9SS outer membrane translocon Sov/SprA [Apibacter adventoris]|uniref:T9SS outer membrane translocon Sov/SprA n=1 Tax=Apibacter adventoris TaxID=1679466 RepID=UPI0021A5CEE3|nr:cell surface protein SprA [Apibacter adventoris]
MKKIHICLLLIFIFIFGNNILLAQENKEEQGLTLDDPVKYEAYYDYKTGTYILYPKVGGVVVGTPITMTADDYTKYVLQKKFDEYYREKSRLQEETNKKKSDATKENKSFIPGVTINSKVFEKIFGGNRIEMKPSGFASFDLGILYQKIDNPQILPQNRKNFTIDLRQRIQMSLMGSVGKNIQLGVNYDTQAGFDFENKIKLAWKPGGIDLSGGNQEATGGEDNIIKSIEFGNVSMPLSTSLITGAQSLFGIKGEFQFGKTYLTTVFSEQQSEARNITVQGGGIVNTYKLKVADYEDNQHYFLAHYFRNNYDNAVENYPVINSTINITRLEVWRIDLGNSNLQDQRPILALRDLGEAKGYTTRPDNNNKVDLSNPTSKSVYAAVDGLGNVVRESSTVYNAVNGVSLPSITSTTSNNEENYLSGQNFAAHKRVKKLAESEYSFNSQLGYISLNQKLNNDQLLAVAFQYTDSKTPGTIYKVGEFSNDRSNVLIVKLLKPNEIVSTTSPMWDLMMKNIYSIEGSQINSEDFVLNVMYQDPSQGKINYLPDPNVKDRSLIQVLNWDRLNQNNDVSPSGKGDGIFDFVDGITINPEKGKLIFTKVEPFGEYLASKSVANQYIFRDLYKNLKNSIQVTSNPLSDRYIIEGRFKGTIGNGISLGAFNVPKGSVKVTANGQTLMEGVDYIVDYQMGMVTIINETYKSSGVPINISLENQFAFNMQKKRFMGLNVEHKFSEEFVVGATFLNYKERPLTQKVQYGSEPVNNSMVGFNMMLNKQAPFLTKLANWIPGIKTEAESNLSLKIEGAALIPGQNKTINDESYIDDFETTASKISLKDPNYWGIASRPELYGDFDIKPATNDPLQNGYGRGLTSWYNIDPRFFGIGGGKPSGIDNNTLSRHLQRRVEYKELFPNKDYIAGEQVFMNTFDVSFYPQERGPYNFNVNENSPSFEINKRWGGLMRPITVTNFVEANIEYLEFWMMDPYADSSSPSSNPLGNNPELIIQLGNVSEDVLKDGQLLYENGITENKSELTSTIWGYQPKNYPLVYAFDTEGEARRKQDIGYDGLSSIDEIMHFGSYLNINDLPNLVNPITGETDPSADDFVFYLNKGWDSTSSKGSIIDRYKYYRNLEGNSPSNSLDASSAVPDSEDLNKDYNLDETENYNQYRLSLTNTELQNSTNSYIADRKKVEVSLPNGKKENTTWYLVRIPVSSFEAGKGKTEILNNVRYIRMLMRGFTNTATLRFATFDLVRSDWRKYERNISPLQITGKDTNEGGTPLTPVNNIALSAVNLEENSTSNPPYVLPPGISREILGNTTGTQMQNESSLKLEITDLDNKDPRGIYKNIHLDMRRYKKMKMFVHAENLQNPSDNKLDENAKFFIRIGSDLSDNYYEYEIPLKYTSNTAKSPLDIWPIENFVELDLKDLVAAKNEKDKLNSYNSDIRYRSNVTGDPNKIIYVKGRPSIGNVSSIMMGVRNTDNLTGAKKNIILWLNELRLTDIDNDGGYAANASISFNLADFAEVTASGTYKSVGFGALDSKPSERSQDETKQYMVSTSVNVDKVLPENWGIKIPVSVGISETFIDPKYNPLDNDVKFKNDPRKNELKKIVRTYSSQKNFAVTNLRKDRTTNKKPSFYDIENLSVSFAYSDDYYRDIYTSYSIKQNLQASLDYNFTPKGKFYQPFNGWPAAQDTSRFAKYLKLLKEINFNPIPTKLSFRTEIARTYNEFQYRDVEAYINGNPSSYFPTYANNFLFGWQYNIGFNLTRSLKLDFTTATRTILDDPGNGIADDGMIWDGLFKSGRPINYNQKFQANYKVPVHFLPYMDFTSVELGYTGQYDWQANSNSLTNYIDPNTQLSRSLGNTAQNSQTITVIGNADFNKLYSYFTGYNNFEERKQKRQREIDSLNQAYEANFTLKKPKTFKKYNLKNKLKPTDYLWMVLGSIKRGQVQVNENKGTILPGFLPEPSFFGVGSYRGSSTGPTFGFLFGSQFDLRNKAVTEGWISTDELMTSPYVKTNNSQLTANLQLEPVDQLLIDLNIMRNHQQTLSQSGFNLIDPITNQRKNTYENRTAMFSSTVISISTAFKSKEFVYNKMVQNSKIISERIAIRQGQPLIDANNDGYIDGYGLTNSEVLIPSFVSAFTGKSPGSQKLGYKRGMPIPNWKISYAGLKNIPFINYWFKDIRINHGYISNYTVNGVQSNPDYFAQIDGGSTNMFDGNGNRLNYNNYGTVVMSEGFSPLIGADVTMRNNMQIRIAYNKDRVSSLGLTNYTLQEDYGDEVVFGLGYILKDVKLKLRYRGDYKTIKGDLNIRGDVSIRDNKTTIRRLVELDSQVTGGQNLVSVKFSTDYNFSKNFNLKFFYEQMITKYKISTAYPLSTIRAGLSATFTFGN